MNDPEMKKKYDTSVKEYKIYEKGENYFIFRSWFHSPIFFIAERDVVDKRISFTKDNIYYSISTSVDDYDPPKDSVVRIITYLNAMTISEDENNFYFNCLSQIDAKVLYTYNLRQYSPQKY